MPHAGSSFLAFAFAACVGCGGAAPTTDAPTGTSDPDSLLIDPNGPKLSHRPDLVAKLRKSPHRYFRIINTQFGDQVCRLHHDLSAGAPDLNLHGDAHVEQYAVTSTARGLSDFDDAAVGPSVLDLVRFGVSLQLVARERGFASQSLDGFLDGYRQALKRPGEPSREPSVVARLRAGPKEAAGAFQDRAEQLMRMPSEENRPPFRRGYRRYVSLMKERLPELGEDFFELKRYGRLNIGVGSASDLKFLMRIEGPTPSPADDVILEAKELQDLTGIRCIKTKRATTRLRVLLGHSPVGAHSDPFRVEVPPGPDAELAGFLPFWVQSWIPTYRELRVADLQSAEELDELAFDVGVDLGRIHTRRVSRGEVGAVRAALHERLDQHEAELRDAVDVMTRRVVDGWTEFVRSTD